MDGIISPLSSDIGSVRIDLFLRPQDAVTAVVPLDKEKIKSKLFIVISIFRYSIINY